MSKTSKHSKQTATARTDSHHKLHIVFFTFFVLEYGGGSEHDFIETANGITQHDESISVTVVTATPRLTKFLQYLVAICCFKRPEGTVHRESTASIHKKLGKATYTQVHSFSELATIFRNCDLIYAKNEILELFIIKLLNRRLHKPVVIKIATPIFYPITQTFSDKLHNLVYTGPFYKWLIKNAAAIKVVNAMDDKRYIETHFGINNTHVVHNVIDATLGHQMQNSDTNLRILFVGRLTSQKGADILIQTIETLAGRPDFNRFHFKIAGSGDAQLAEQLTDLSHRYANVEYLGHVPNSDILALYDWTDVTVIPSRYETLNRVAAETAAAGKVVICTDIPGPREIITNNETGYLIPLGHDSFAKKILDVADAKRTNKSLLHEIGLRAQQKVADEFNTTKVYDDFRKLFLSVNKD